MRHFHGAAGNVYNPTTRKEEIILPSSLPSEAYTHPPPLSSPLPSRKVTVRGANTRESSKAKEKMLPSSFTLPRSVAFSSRLGPHTGAISHWGKEKLDVRDCSPGTDHPIGHSLTSTSPHTLLGYQLTSSKCIYCIIYHCYWHNAEPSYIQFKKTEMWAPKQYPRTCAHCTFMQTSHLPSRCSHLNQGYTYFEHRYPLDTLAIVHT